MKTDMISVIMSIFNEPVDWIKQSIDSILNQTYGDFEFIIVNDNPESSENQELLCHYAAIDKRIKIITNPYNLGLTKSLNIAVSLAKGEFIARMDADDISLPFRLEKQMRLMQDNRDCDYTSSDFIVFSNEKTCYLRKAPKNNKALAELILTYNPICHPSVLFRTESIDVNNLYDEECPKSQDYALWLKLMIEGKKYIGISEPLIKYRISDRQISTRQMDVQAKYASIARSKALSLYFSNLKVNNIKCNQYSTDNIYQIMKKSGDLKDIDKMILFLLNMSNKGNVIKSFKVALMSLFKYKLSLKYSILPLISIFTSRYDMYDMTEEIKRMCEL